MRYFTSCMFSIAFLSGCGGGGSDTPEVPVVVSPPPVEVIVPTVNAQPTYNVSVTYDVKYGEGLTHADWNAPDAVPMDLYLDVYAPEGSEADNHPIVIFVHGGGFTAGDKSFSRISDFMHYFAERGYVGFAINYRLAGDYGTIPASINDYVDSIDTLTDNAKDRMKAMYPATRDAKAALRWIVANKDTYKLDVDYITAIGGSAGSVISIAMGVTQPLDFTREIDAQDDPTIETIYPDVTAKVHTVINNWGTGAAVNLINDTYTVDRWDSTDAPTLIVHGMEDHIYSYDEALALRDKFIANEVHHAFYPLENVAHGDWDAIIEGKSLAGLAFDFAVDAQELEVNE